MSPIQITRIETFVFRVPLAQPVRTSFGTMHERPAIFLRIMDSDGAEGFGEIWCNFPTFGSIHRARMVDEFLAPLLREQPFARPRNVRLYLERQTHTLGLQSGELGPLANCIAGIDTAVHDLCARKAGQPLCRYLGAQKDSVPVYASGINPVAAAQTASNCVEQGYTALKFKAGFGMAVDMANVASVIEEVGEHAWVAMDANQAWNVTTAREMMEQIDEFGLKWLEEPLPADSLRKDWLSLREAGSTPLAAGENALSSRQLGAVMTGGAMSIIQPDVAKWGGISGCLAAAQSAQKKGLTYYPHFLGGGVGLLASAHLLAAVGGEGRLEVDINPNPLRSEILGDALDDPGEGLLLSDAPGLGFSSDFSELADYQTYYGSNG